MSLAAHEPQPEALHAQPGWVLFGGCLLAFVAAALNADFMLRLGVSVSHLTGDLSRITSESIKAGGHWTHEASVLCISVAGFVAGAATSGYFIHHPQLELGRPYGRCVVFIGLLLLLTHAALQHSVLLACAMAAWACGMQNALATRYRGLILRTTHITGLLTDLGQLLGMRLRGHPIERWKLSTPFLLAASFAVGSLTGSMLCLRTTIPVTQACGLLYIAGGCFWFIFKRWRQSKNIEA